MGKPPTEVDGEDLWTGCLQCIPKGVVISACSEAGLSQGEIDRVIKSREAISGQRRTPQEKAREMREARRFNIEAARANGRTAAITGFSVLFAFLGLSLIGFVLPDFWLLLILGSAAIAHAFDHFDS